MEKLVDVYLSMLNTHLAQDLALGLALADDVQQRRLTRAAGAHDGAHVAREDCPRHLCVCEREGTWERCVMAAGASGGSSSRIRGGENKKEKKQKMKRKR